MDRSASDSSVGVQGVTVVWVTGSTGMLGSALIRSYASLRPSVEVLAPSSAQLDLTQADSVMSFARRNRPDIVVHAAAKVGGIAANVADPVGFMTANMNINNNVILAARAAGVPALLNIGSSSIYPQGESDGLRESDVMTGQLDDSNAGYAFAKLAADQLCNLISIADGLSYRTLVLSNMYGPHDNFAPERSHLIASIISKTWSALITGSPVIEIWGDGSARREFSFSLDVADWLVCASELEFVQRLPPRLNLGVGVDFSVGDYYRTVASLMGFEGEFVLDRSKPSGVARRLMDSSLARGYGWDPQTTLEDGLRATIDYFTEAVVGDGLG